jgi:hypothetical protein
MRSIQFCALEYSPHREEILSSRENIVVLLLRAIDGDLRVLIHPEWRAIVEQTDRDYIGEILSDLKVRAQIDPDNLLKQAVSLSVGPLVVHREGPDLTKCPGLLSLSKKFVNAADSDT